MAAVCRPRPMGMRDGGGGVDGEEAQGLRRAAVGAAQVAKYLDAPLVRRRSPPAQLCARGGAGRPPGRPGHRGGVRRHRRPSPAGSAPSGPSRPGEGWRGQREWEGEGTSRRILIFRCRAPFARTELAGHLTRRWKLWRDLPGTYRILSPLCFYSIRGEFRQDIFLESGNLPRD